MVGLLQDVRYALRQLRRSPGFSAVAVITLALGIGANTAIFSVINSALIEPLPYPRAEQLVCISETLPDGRPNGSNSGGAFKDWRDQSSSFSHIAVYEQFRRNLTGFGVPERVTGFQVSREFLPTLGIAPAIGRGFAPGEDAIGGNHRVAILAYEFWQSRFGGNPGVIGGNISLDQVPHTVIGVLGPNALLQDDAQLLIPEVIDEPGIPWGRAGHWREVIARLKPGIAPSAAQAELRGIKQRLSSEYPSFKKDWSVAVIPLREIYAANARPRLMILFGAVGLVLLIACANVSNLLLARGSARSRETAIRAALGAGTSRVIRQTAVESLLLALGGSVLGLILASAGLRLLTRLVVQQLPHLLYPQLNLRVLFFTIIVSCGCGVLFGILPAWRAARTAANGTLKETERGTLSVSRKRAQSFLVISEFALTLVLLIGAGLFLRSFLRLLETDPGFNPQHTLAFDLSVPDTKYPKPEDQLQFTKELLGRVQALPGVASASAISTLPLSGTERGEYITRADKPQVPPTYTAGIDSVTGDYFSTAQIKLLRGRGLTEADNAPSSSPAMVIDTSIARDFFPGENPLGHRLILLEKSYEIVGIVAPVRQRDMGLDPRPRVYAPQAHVPRVRSFVVRTTVPPFSLVETIRKTVAAADPDQPITNVRTLEQDVEKSLSPRRASLILLGTFAGLAVGLACLGIYGVVSYAVGQRLRELSIRSALGAQRRDILGLVIRNGMKPSAVGIGIGLLSSVAFARLLQNQLFEVNAHDPLVFVSSIVLLSFVAIVSVYLPARRASRVEPIVALRYE